MRNLNFNRESGSEPYTPTGQSVSAEGFYSPEFKGDFGAGLLDLHAMDDTELLPELFEPSPFMLGSTASFDGDNNLISNKQLRGQGQADTDAPAISTAFDKEIVPK